MYEDAERPCAVSQVSIVLCNLSGRRHCLDHFVIVALYSDVALVVFLESLVLLGGVL